MSFFSCWQSLQRRGIRGTEDLTASIVAKKKAEEIVLQDKAIKEEKIEAAKAKKREIVAEKKAAKEAVKEAAKGKGSGKTGKTKAKKTTATPKAKTASKAASKEAKVAPKEETLKRKVFKDLGGKLAKHARRGNTDAWTPALRTEALGLLPRAAQPESEVSSTWDDDVESYTCHSCNTTLQVWIRKRTFYVVRAQRGVPLAATGKPLRTCKMNAKGGMTVGWKDSIAVAWEVAVEVAGGIKEAKDGDGEVAKEEEDKEVAPGEDEKDGDEEVEEEAEDVQ